MRSPQRELKKKKRKQAKVDESTTMTVKSHIHEMPIKSSHIKCHSFALLALYQQMQISTKCIKQQTAVPNSHTKCAYSSELNLIFILLFSADALEFRCVFL